MFKLLILIILSVSNAGTNQSFQVNFLGVPSAKVDIKSEDIYYNEELSKLISFSTMSMSLTKYIFNVDNYYETIVTNNAENILSFKKETSQPNLINTLKTYQNNGEVLYQNSDSKIPSNTFNIFSLLYFISNNKITTKTIVNIEREGILYYGTIIPIDISDNNIIKYELLLNENYMPDNNPAIQHTDIFTWALFKKKSKKYITVNYNHHEIVECIFKSGFINMIAKNNRY